MLCITRSNSLASDMSPPIDLRVEIRTVVTGRYVNAVCLTYTNCWSSLETWFSSMETRLVTSQSSEASSRAAGSLCASYNTTTQVEYLGDYLK